VTDHLPEGRLTAEEIALWRKLAPALSDMVIERERRLWLGRKLRQYTGWIAGLTAGVVALRDDIASFWPWSG